MQNPFSRLKHYLRDETDPQENHATECLAACLVLSSKIRAAFIQFLLDSPMRTFDLADVEVVTQKAIEGGGYIDLLLQQQGKFVVALEVKVRSAENCDHHQRQLQRYKKWLDEQNEADGHLFTLVRNQDNTFLPEHYGADRNGRRTWAALYKRFKTMLRENDLSDVESSLIKNFCDYLESEAIVSTYETKDLLSYAAGVKARKAVTGIFNEVTARLEADGFKTVSIEGRKDNWPELRIQHPRWKRIFGKGENWKISLFFCVPGIWDAKQHEFRPEILIWQQDHGNDWQFAKAKLPVWLKTLKSQNFKWDVYQTWNKRRQNAPAKEILGEPKQINAWKDGERDNVILNQNQVQSEDALVDLLVDRVRQYAKTVDSLGG
jgi:hypothetical protein